MDADAVLKKVNFYRRAYNSPDAKWSKSLEDLAQRATRHNCKLGKIEHSVCATINHLFNPCSTSQGPATTCSLGVGIESVEKMIASWCENTVLNTGDTEAKRYCDRGYYKNPKAVEVRSFKKSIDLTRRLMCKNQNLCTNFITKWTTNCP